MKTTVENDSKLISLSKESLIVAVGTEDVADSAKELKKALEEGSVKIGNSSIVFESDGKGFLIRLSLEEA